MKKTSIRIIALLMAVSLLFSGCGVIGLGGYFDRLAALFFNTPFEDMEYTRPDVTELETALDACIESAATETDVEALVEKIYDFNYLYTNFCTQYMLAYIHYSIDLTDTYWETEYTYCSERVATADAALDQLMYALADSPLREELEHKDYFGEGYFDDYDGESVWDEEFTALMEQESVLMNEYYDLSSQALEAEYGSEEYYSVYGTQMEELFVELIALRQQISQQAGFSSYPEFAYDFYYYRDYTVTDATAYVEQIKTALVPLYRELNESDFWDQTLEGSSEHETFSYVEQMAESMGGDIADAFELLKDAELYHIEYGENKYNASFETYLYDYYEPFVFMNPTMTINDQLTFAHEFGHFCNDYVSFGSKPGIDVAEIFSQGMEYLSLCYAEDTETLETMKMADSLNVYVEQSAFASFEQAVYGLSGDDLTAENVRALYEQTGIDYGFDSWGFDSRSYVSVTHLFTNPMYIISYVVSNDAAMQLYQMEQENSGSGLEAYTANLATEQAYFLAFLEEAGLESPFAEGRIEAVRKTFNDVLG